MTDLAHRRRNQRGFTLVELLIVLTVILIIAAIAIPKLLSVKQHANSVAAAMNVRALNNAIAQYEATYPAIGCPASLTALGPPAPGAAPSSAAADILDESMSGAATTPKQGYLFVYTPTAGTPCSLYTINANPTAGSSNRYFFSDESGVIRQNDNAAATATSQIIG